MINKIIAVKWYDANQRDFTLEQLGNMKTNDMLVTQTTFGKLIGITKDIVVIQHEEDDYSVETKDCTVIPRSWIRTPRKLRDERMKL